MEQLDQGLQEQRDFLAAWPIERLKSMTLEEYTNLDKDTSFIYWLEKKTEKTGSIWGGSAFKFGIYKRRASEFYERSSVMTDGEYAWMKKYGTDREEAFQNIKDIVISIAEYSSQGAFSNIDSIDLGNSVKWKIAFLYNPNSLVPIFNFKVLARAAEGYGLVGAFEKETSELQKFLIDKKPVEYSTLNFSRFLWNKYNLENFYATLEKFMIQAQTENLKKQGYPTTYEGLELKVGFGAGIVTKVPWIAFLKAPNQVTDGIFPVYFYFKDQNLLILAYGVSEANPPKQNWSNVESLKTVQEWFHEHLHQNPDRYGASYVKAVYDLKEQLDPDQVQSDLDEILEQYSNSFVNEPEVSYEGPSKEDQGKKTWLLAAGEGGHLWNEFYEKGIASVWWDRIGDLRNYSSREEIRKELQKQYPEYSMSQKHNSLCLWQFSREMKPGDIVIAKKGTSEYLGYGVVSGSYYFDESKADYKNILPVDWMKKGVWEEKTAPIVTKTLTEIGKYPDYVDRLKRMIGIEQPVTVAGDEVEYYWLNANPKVWKIEDYQVGEEQSYTAYNENGNKRSRFEYFQKIKPGDLIIGYETTPVQKVVAIFEATQGMHVDEDTGKEEISFVIQKFLPTPISLSSLKRMPELVNSEVMKNNQGSLFRLTKAEFNAIVDSNISNELDLPPYTIENAEKEIFLEREKIEEIIDSLQYKKNIILQGPPGVGKTFMAKRLAYLMMEEKDPSKIEMVQFHQSYSYEDFIQGYRPTEAGNFKLENGIFYRFCKRAQTDPENDYFFIIDEINRGNLSKIFGEVMLLIEADKRGTEFGVSMTYTSSTENRFFIPDNLYLIGTMNTADRSLAMVDYALRRRFAFIDLDPAFNKKFQNELLNLGVEEGLIEPIIKRISALNDEILEDISLGRGFKVGHSYFCNVPQNTGDLEWYHGIIKHEIAPLIREYWFDKEEKAGLAIKRLFIEEL